MKKTGMILGGIAVLLAIIIAALPTRSEPQQDRQESSSLNILPYSTANRNSSQENILNSAAPTAANRQTVYIVKEYQNVIGVFFEEEGIPFRVIDVPVSTLPEEDKKMFEEGIRISDEKDLQKFLENYES